MRIKGKYIATIEAYIDYNTEETFPSSARGKMDFPRDTLKYEIADALYERVFDRVTCKVKVHEQCKDLYYRDEKD